MAKKKLTNKDRLKLLEERYKKKEISKETYESMKKELKVKEPAVAAPKPEKTPSKLSQDDKLKLLEERKAKGEISDETYKELKADLAKEKPKEVTPAPAPETKAAPPKAKKFPMIPVLAAAVVIIIIIALAASGILGPYADSKKEGDENITYEEPTSWEDTETIEGDIAGGGPMTFVPDERVDFEVEETVVKMEITLTWSPQSLDLDLEIEDSEGNNRGSSANAPGDPESITIKKNIKPGTWTAIIDPFAAINVHYTLEIIYSHESGNDTGGGEGVLYQKVIELSGETGEESDNFNVGEEYESLLIQLVVNSAGGSMTLEIMDPEGDVVYSEEISGESEVVSEESTPAVSGEWTVNYTFEDFTGDLVLQIVGS